MSISTITRLDGQPDEGAIRELFARTSGSVLTPGSPGYDAARAVHNGVVDKQLQANEWIAGGQYSIADMSLMPWMRFPERQGVSIDDYPHLKKWRDRIAGRPAVKKALEVLAERRRTTPSFSKEQAEVLFGATQYARR